MGEPPVQWPEAMVRIDKIGYGEVYYSPNLKKWVLVFPEDNLSLESVAWVEFDLPEMPKWLEIAIGENTLWSHDKDRKRIVCDLEDFETLDKVMKKLTILTVGTPDGDLLRGQEANTWVRF